MTKKTTEIIITAIVTLAIVVLVGGFIKDYLTSPEPVFYLEESCYHNFNKNKEESFSATLRNMGEVSGLATLCVSSKEFVFKTSSGELLHQVCWSESEISPKQTDLKKIYTITAKPDANIFDSVENATIKIDVSCRQKIWSVGTRECESVTNLCKYTKERDYFNKVI